METIVQGLGTFLSGILDLVAALGAAIVPWLPVVVWLLFWLLVVDWRELWPVLRRGAWLGVLAAGGLAALIWQVVSPGDWEIIGIRLVGVAGKAVVVAELCLHAVICGLIQTALTRPTAGSPAANPPSPDG